ncbi:hypothetical protein MRB53_037001 [Persea americana]|nr:hypothetical protein MRB53_037001 [Persea americana]
MDLLDKAITPLRPHLLPIIHNLPAPVADFGRSLLGEQCYSTLVDALDLSPSSAQCFSLAISKALGVGIVGTSAIVKLPQLIKLLTSQSAKGLSFTSYLLETAALVISLAYNTRNGFPFSTYGESAFIAVQNVAIAALILVFSKRAAGAAVFIAGLATAGYALFGENTGVSHGLLSYLQAGAGLLGVASKVFNYLVGSGTRIFTTLKEVPDKLILYGFIAGFALNAVLAAQMLYYWNSTPAKTAGKRAKAKPAQQQPMAQAQGQGAASGASPRSKGPTTRRRV